MRPCHSLAVLAAMASTLLVGQEPGIRWLDLDGDVARQTTVRRVPRQYLGHPSTVLLGDGTTMLCAHPEGHGKGRIALQRSDDGGLHWSEPLPVPENWASSLETPTIHRLVDRAGKARLVLFSGLHPIRSSISEDDGRSWTPLAPIGAFGGIVAMASVVRLANGDHAAFFHDDGRFFRENGERGAFTVWQTRSHDGGLTWSAPATVVAMPDVDLCEPGVVRSPDGKRLAMLLRENSRRGRSMILFSDDEAETWGDACRAMPAVLCGDRHVGAYAPDGRLLVSFRDMAKDSPTRGDWVAWVGTFDDLVAGREGQYRVRLSRNWRGSDCGYPGVEVLAGGTFVLTSYGHWEPGEAPFVRSVRLQLGELDELATGPAPTFAREMETLRPVPRSDAWWQQRVADDLAAARAGGHQVVFVGDSITQGWNAAGAACWQEVWAGRRALNLGVSGDRTQHVLWRLDHEMLAALAAPNNDVRAAVVMIGTNNSNGDDNSAEEIAAGVQAVVRRLRDALPRARVLLLAIFPRGEKPGAQRDKCARASELAAAAFAGDDMVSCRDIAAHFVGADGVISKDVMPDFLHLSAAAYRAWADAIVGDVDVLVAR
ncbi:MAG TPA: GDSL-type esterase/lipase family protein [Planctomycetota bacterium]